MIDQCPFCKSSLIIIQEGTKSWHISCSSVPKNHFVWRMHNHPAQEVRNDSPPNLDTFYWQSDKINMIAWHIFISKMSIEIDWESKITITKSFSSIEEFVIFCEETEKELIFQ